MQPIFGYSWESIQRAQNGGALGTTVNLKNASRPTALESDVDLLKEHGEIGLTELGFFGVLDRLKTSGFCG